MSKLIDIKGQRFNHLTVLSDAGADSRRERLWRCRCDCGQETVVTGSYIRSGHTKTCGCRIGQGLDLAERRFGKLTALRKLPPSKKRATARTDAQWVCLCACGREKTVMTGELVSGHITTCGNCAFGRYAFIGDTAVCHLENGDFFTIDRKDHALISKYRWWNNGHGYYVTSVAGKKLSLHDLLLPPQPGAFRDHINRDKSDNRRVNLRYASAAENQRNRGLQRNNTSGFIGVSWHRSFGKCRALIECGGKSINLGQYNAPEEAARVRDRAALVYFCLLYTSPSPRDTR